MSTPTYKYEMYTPVDIGGVIYVVADRWVGPDGIIRYELESAGLTHKLRTEDELTALVQSSWAVHGCDQIGHAFVDTGMIRTWCKRCNIEGESKDGIYQVK